MHKNIPNTKKDLRIWAKKTRTDLFSENKNKNIIHNIRQLKEYQNAKNVMIYHPLEKEINLLPLLQDNKNFSFPRIINNNICPYSNGKNFEKKQFNVMEPINTEIIDIKKLDIIILPGLVADRSGNRLGYGKGYYDRFIKKIDKKNTKLLFCVYDELIVPKINIDEHDEKVDIIITDKQTLFI